MKAKIKTAVLKELVAKAVNGAGNNKMLPITSLVELRITGKQLELTTTDMVHFLYVAGVVEEVDDDFIVVIELEKFAKLISKTTVEYTTIEVGNRAVLITGNGSYTLDIPLNENGEWISYPKPATQSESASYSLQKTMVDLILNTCKPSIAKTFEVPVYTNYYIGKNILATDTYAISAIDVELFADKKLLIPSDLMDLLSVFTSETISVVFANDNYVWFDGGSISVLGKLADGIDEYAVEPIQNLVNQEFDSSCKFKKAEILSALERIALFVGPYDDSAIKLVFTDKAISIESKQTNGIETISYTEIENYAPFSCLVNINMLISQVKAYNSDVITMQYGAINSIKFVDGAVTQVIALLED